MLKIEKISIIDQVIQSLESTIESGEYPIGSKLPPEMELSKELGVGRSTIREAFRMLQAFGLVELKPGKGAFVKNNKRYNLENIRNWFVEKEAELSDLMEVRMAVEPLAVKLAIKKGTKEQINRIVKLHDQFREASEKGNVIQLAELDENFHSAIMEATNNHLLIKIHKLIAETFKEYRTKSFAVPENVKDALEPHEAIVKALIEKHEQKAIDAMNNHLRISLEDIEEVVHE